MMEYEYDYQPDDPYCYPGTKVLINKLNITDPEQFYNAERRITALRLSTMPEQFMRGRFGLTHLCAIHRHIFGDVYDWAGEVRKGEFLAKGNTIFCLGRHIDNYSDSIFSSLADENRLKRLDKNKFIERLAFYMGEVNALHPFRDGNGRTAREFFRLLSQNAGYDLDIGSVDKDALLSADIAAFNRQYQPLIDVLNSIIHKI